MTPLAPPGSTAGAFRKRGTQTVAEEGTKAGQEMLIRGRKRPLQRGMQEEA